MPARSTMITGQYVRTHGVVANGVALPPDSPSVAAYLHEKAGYRTALLGKAHFEPAFDLQGRWFENQMARKNSTGPYRGFDRMELAMHSPIGGWHYSLWLQKNHPEDMGGFAPLLTAMPGGDTGAPEVKYNPVAREHYHTDWVAARTIAYLDSLDPDDNWFVWYWFSLILIGVIALVARIDYPTGFRRQFVIVKGIETKLREGRVIENSRVFDATPYVKSDRWPRISVRLQAIQHTLIYEAIEKDRFDLTTRENCCRFRENTWVQSVAFWEGRPTKQVVGDPDAHLIRGCVTGVHNREQNAQSLADNGLKFRFLKSRKHVSALRIVERFARDVPLPDSDNQGKNRDKNSGR